MADRRSVSAVHRRRLTDLRSRLDRAGADAMLVTCPADQFYLTGATIEDSAVLVTPQAVVIVTDSRFGEQLRRQVPWAKRVLRTGQLADAVAGVVRNSRSIRTLAAQAEHVAVAAFRELTRKLKPARLKPTTGLLAEARLVKDASEIRCIERAIATAESAFGATRRHVKPGATEREIAAELVYRMQRAGASGASFEPTVAVGANAALPHARPGATRVRASQAVLIDWGARVDGYCSDLTRVVELSRVPAKVREIRDVVLEAQRAGIDAVRPGASSREVDKAARDVIERAGYGNRFGHGLGHGIGLDIHEGPRLSPQSDATLAAGMVVTIEPGIYIPGIGGVRIEDDVLVTRTGHRVLTNLAK